MSEFPPKGESDSNYNPPASTDNDTAHNIATPSRHGPPGRNLVRDPRKTRHPPTSLDDPRMPPNRDLLALERRGLWVRTGDPHHLNEYPYFYSPSRVQLGAPVAPLVATSSQSTGVTSQAHPRNPMTPAGSPQNHIGDDGSLTLPIYRYTKKVELVNDEMGYGERIVEPFFMRHRDEHKLIVAYRVSQRTKSGRQHLFLADENLDVHDDI
jgi:hypothetical protein